MRDIDQRVTSIDYYFAAYALQRSRVSQQDELITCGVNSLVDTSAARLSKREKLHQATVLENLY